MRLVEIADKLCCQLEGDGEIDIHGIATLQEAQPGHLSFLTNAKYLPNAMETKASAIIVSGDQQSLPIPLLKSPNPYLTFAKALELFYPEAAPAPQIHPSAIISDKATIGKGVTIGAYSFIGDDVILSDAVMIEPHCTILQNARIGAASIILAGCVIREGVIIGNRCIIHSNCVVGSDGFGYAKQDDGSWYKIRQTGTVIIEDEVEIGAGTTIDRATLGATIVRKGAKLDNLVQIGHGSSVGNNSLLCSQVGLAGSSIIGNNVILAGQVGVAGHLTIGDNVTATAQTGIPNSVEQGKVISGYPAIENRQWLKSSAVFARLPDLVKTVRNLEKRLEDMESTFNVSPNMKQDNLSKESN